MCQSHSYRMLGNKIKEIWKLHFVFPSTPPRNKWSYHPPLSCDRMQTTVAYSALNSARNATHGI
uniref:Uncharacterized protein n=1 Tax=Aegilops tauschii subsp. strangulata TaxID=200361 RepID=A0A453C6H3_AEGTS